MSKSVLIIDKPESCERCRLFCEGACYITETTVKDVIPSDCPLKDLPAKEQCNEYNFENFENARSRGWNNFYDMITKGTMGEMD